MAIEDKLIRHQIFLNRFAATVAKQMQKGIDEAKNEVLAAIINNPELKLINTRELEADLLTNLDVAMVNAYNSIEALTVVEKDFFKKVLEAELKETLEDVESEKLKKELEKNNMPVGLEANERNKNIVVAYTQFADQNAKALIQPLKDAQVVETDLLDLSTSIQALAAGLLAVQSRALSNASVVHASSVSKDTFLLQNKGLASEVEWVSVLDSKTTKFCKKQNGKRYRIGQGPRPPAHYNCRSLTKPIINK